MCGIAGFLTNNNSFDKQKVLNKMLEKIKHRGPDADGIYVNKNLYFGHKRLIVLDPERGAQPMIHKKKFNYVITYNGEIYNIKQIKKKLLDLNIPIETNCDTELVLKSYVYLGDNFLDYLNGIFAFAIYDEEKQKIFLARDRFGVKPLFYYFDQKNFVFASEIKSLFEFPNIEKKISFNGLQEIFALSPARTFGNAIFDNIQELEPGFYLELKNNNLIKKRYFKLKYMPHTENIDQTAEHVYFLLKQAVERQLNSDVPLGTFLSGGLDSSIISAIAKEKINDLKTFSLSFEDNQKYFSKSILQPDSDDFWAKKMCEFLKTDHYEITLNNFDLANNLEPAFFMRDLPGMGDVDSSLLLFCKEIKNYVTVALSGECADEIFGGYPWFYRNDLSLDNNFFPWMQNFDDRENLLKINLDLKNYAREKYLNLLKDAPEFPENNPEEKNERDLFYLNINYFMGNMLERKDRMSMANGLEVRVPFCDHELVEYVFNIPWKIKFYNQREKGILRRAIEIQNKNILPQEIIWRKKNPYPKTYHPEYEKLIFKLLKQKLKDNSLNQIIDTKKLFKLIKQKKPWYGQLLSGPQLASYFFQIACLFD